MNLRTKIKEIVLIVLMFSIDSQKILAQDIVINFKTGADQPEKYLPMLKGKTVAVVTNHTGLLKDRAHLVDFLMENKINIKHIFAPEHGFRGDADAGEYIDNEVDDKTGLLIISLYGMNKKPTSEQMDGIDLVLFDIQDVGVRFYTYLSTLTYVMEAASESGAEVVVLDRPNPHDGYTDGPVLKQKWKTFVGLHPVPVIYGLTIGEYGKMVNGERWLRGKKQVKYTIVPMKGYYKTKRYVIAERPSPNLPNEKSINLYPSLCFFEGTQVSVGRGTNVPFQVYGSPWIKNMNYQFIPQSEIGAKNPFLKGYICYGEDLSQYPNDLRKLNLDWVIKAYNNYENPKKDFFLIDAKGRYWFDILAGTDELRKQILSHKSIEQIRESWKKDLEDFEKVRQKYIIYPD